MGIDNVSCHSSKDVDVALPDNIILLPMPTYCPEKNPAEKNMWNWTKDQIAMKIYDNLNELETKIKNLIQTAENQIIISITVYPLYLEAYSRVFKEQNTAKKLAKPVGGVVKIHCLPNGNPELGKFHR